MEIRSWKLEAMDQILSFRQILKITLLIMPLDTFEMDKDFSEFRSFGMEFLQKLNFVFTYQMEDLLFRTAILNKFSQTLI